MNLRHVIDGNEINPLYRLMERIENLEAVINGLPYGHPDLEYHLEDLNHLSMELVRIRKL